MNRPKYLVRRDKEATRPTWWIVEAHTNAIVARFGSFFSRDLADYRVRIAMTEEKRAA